MNKIVECVPNVSEGRNKEIIERLANTIRSVKGVILLDIEPGEATNRTVYTFVGEPESVFEAAYKLIENAKSLIDMRKHKGEHPRIGAVDVVPFVPIRNVTMDECVELARRLGKKVGEELNIPVYLYEYAATADYRRSLADIREGEYESLPRKLADPRWKPDFGPSEWNEEVAKSGAIVIGAREFLIAYNINLNTKDKTLANEIAKKMRESGYTKKLPDGSKERVPGRLKAVRAIGWYIEEYKRAQISVNLLNYKITPLWMVYEVAREEAEKLGLRVTGSEIVGLVPLEAILDTGMYYLQKQGKSRGLNESEIIHTAMLSLGLNEVAKFDPMEKIIEYRIERELKEYRLANLSVREFSDELASTSPAPGGGSASAISLVMASALISMVSNISYEKTLLENRSKLENIAIIAQNIRKSALRLFEEDTTAFNNLLAAYKFKGDEKEKKKLINDALRKAIEVPMEVLDKAREALSLSKEIEGICIRNALSDVGCATVLAYAAGLGAALNVLINLKDVEDETEKKVLIDRCESIVREIENEFHVRFESIRRAIIEMINREEK